MSFKSVCHGKARDGVTGDAPAVPPPRASHSPQTTHGTVTRREAGADANTSAASLNSQRETVNTTASE